MSIVTGSPISFAIVFTHPPILRLVTVHVQRLVGWEDALTMTVGWVRRTGGRSVAISALHPMLSSFLNTLLIFNIYSIRASLLSLTHYAYFVPPSHSPQEKRGRFADLLDAKYLRTTLQIWVIW